MLLGRGDEQAVIDALLDEARAGRARSLVVRGEAGIGKSALLGYAAERAGGDFHVMHVTGVESEAELPYASLHLILGPALGALDLLPILQADALRNAFGQGRTGGTGHSADRFLVGLACLSLLPELSPRRPLLCLADDAQWLDQASADALLFAVRRLQTEQIAVLFAARDGEHAFAHGAGLAELPLTGLDREAAEQLVARNRHGLALAVRDRVVEESDGNPLALIELSRQVDDDSGLGAFLPLPFSLTAPTPVSRVQAAFQERIRALDTAAQRCLLVAALADSEDYGAIAPAVAALGLRMIDFAPAEQAGLLRLTPDGTVRFRHPLVRSAVLALADVKHRMEVHQALAATLDADAAVWHLAATAVGPDDAIATAMEDTARRAGERAAPAIKSAAFERAADLSAGSASKARRLAEAATAALDAGHLPRARDLAVRVARLTDDPMVLARAAAVHGGVEFETGVPHDAARIYLDGAEQSLPEDLQTGLALLGSGTLAAWYSGARPEQDVLAERVRVLSAGLPDGSGPLLDFCRGLMALRAEPWRAGPLAGTVDALEAGAGSVVPAVRGSISGLFLMTGDREAALRSARAVESDFRRKGMAGLLVQPLLLSAMASMHLGTPRTRRRPRRRRCAWRRRRTRPSASAMSPRSWPGSPLSPETSRPVSSGAAKPSPSRWTATGRRSWASSTTPGRPWRWPADVLRKPRISTPRRRPGRPDTA
ncbi:hypothetical protein ABH926_010300 [Catenulispora sp. GP43]|uniref:AAA family ATPase n=1 Tax=Catenulispora sp. GP43 TaxID=3156263 RepID=UPI0035183FD7